MRLRNTLVCGIAVSVALTAVPARAQLPLRSPFLSAQSEMLGTPMQTVTLQYLGFMQTPAEGMKYRLYDTTKKIGGWVTLNERDTIFGVVAKQFDPERKMLTVEQDGRTLALTERELKITSAGVGPPISFTPAGNPPLSAVEAIAASRKVLETTARDVEARRAAREQAASAPPVNQPPARP
jgi:hypothetical protein